MTLDFPIVLEEKRSATRDVSECFSACCFLRSHLLGEMTFSRELVSL